MKRLYIWTLAAFVFCAPGLNGHAQGQNAGQASHGNQSQATVICDLHSLQAAVDRAAEGATITVQGTCTGEVVVRKDRVRIVGESGATLQPPADGVALTIMADGVEIRNLNILGGVVAVDLFNGASAEIAGNQILNYTRAGIEVRANSNGVIVDNYISSPGPALAGVNLLASASAQLENNVIADPGGHGVNIGGTSTGFLAGNQISLTHPFFAGVFVSRTSQVGFSPQLANTISNDHFVGRSIFCSQTSSIFVGTTQNLTGDVARHPNCEVVLLGPATLP